MPRSHYRPCSEHQQMYEFNTSFIDTNLESHLNCSSLGYGPVVEFISDNEEYTGLNTKAKLSAG